MGKYFIISWACWEQKGGDMTWAAMAETFSWSSRLLSL